MKKVITILVLIASFVCSVSLFSCVDKEKTRNAPEFCAVVDSIAENHYKNGELSKTGVISGFDEYISKYDKNSSECPIFKDTKFKLTGFSKALHCPDTISTVFLSFEKEQIVDGIKNLYDLRVVIDWVEADPSTLIEGNYYYIRPYKEVSMRYDWDITLIADKSDSKKIRIYSMGKLEIPGAKLLSANI